MRDLGGFDTFDAPKSKEVREWSQRLRESINQPFEEIPPFGINVWEELEAAVSRRDWREIQTLATGPKFASRTFPPNLGPQVAEAVRRVECLAALDAKSRTNRIREFAAAYRPDLLDDWAEAAPLVAKAKAAKQAVGLLDELDRLEKSDATGRSHRSPGKRCWGQRRSYASFKGSPKPTHTS